MRKLGPIVLFVVLIYYMFFGHLGSLGVIFTWLFAGFAAWIFKMATPRGRVMRDSRSLIADFLFSTIGGFWKLASVSLPDTARVVETERQRERRFPCPNPSAKPFWVRKKEKPFFG